MFLSAPRSTGPCALGFGRLCRPRSPEVSTALFETEPWPTDNKTAAAESAEARNLSTPQTTRLCAVVHGIAREERQRCPPSRVHRIVSALSSRRRHPPIILASTPASFAKGAVVRPVARHLLRGNDQPFGPQPPLATSDLLGLPSHPRVDLPICLPPVISSLPAQRAMVLCPCAIADGDNTNHRKHANKAPANGIEARPKAPEDTGGSEDSHSGGSKLRCHRSVSANHCFSQDPKKAI